MSLIGRATERVQAILNGQVSIATPKVFGGFPALPTPSLSIMAVGQGAKFRSRIRNPTPSSTIIEAFIVPFDSIRFGSYNSSKSAWCLLPSAVAVDVGPEVEPSSARYIVALDDGKSNTVSVISADLLVKVVSIALTCQNVSAQLASKYRSDFSHFLMESIRNPNLAKELSSVLASSSFLVCGCWPI